MVRRFDRRPLPAEVLDRILHSATRAPSAGFSQGLDLLVLEGGDAVRGFWRATADPRFATPYSSAEPPAIVLVLSDRQAYLDRYAAPDKAGLGMDSEAGWPVPSWDMDALLRDLGVPEGRRLVGAVALGYPAADDRPGGSARTRPRRPLDQVVHRGRW